MHNLLFHSNKVMHALSFTNFSSTSFCISCHFHAFDVVVNVVHLSCFRFDRHSLWSSQSLIVTVSDRHSHLHCLWPSSSLTVIVIVSLFSIIQVVCCHISMLCLTDENKEVKRLVTRSSSDLENISYPKVKTITVKLLLVYPNLS